MDDSTIRDMVISHDKVLDSLSSSITSLARTADNTNVKLDKVVDKLSEQNVLIERMNNMDRETGDAFKRVHERIRTVEHVQGNEGCSKLKVSSEQISELQKEVKELTTTIETTDTKLQDKLSIGPVKWFLVVLVGYVVTFGTHITTSIQNLEKVDVKSAAAYQSYADKVSAISSRLISKEHSHTTFKIDDK